MVFLESGVSRRKIKYRDFAIGVESFFDKFREAWSNNPKYSVMPKDGETYSYNWIILINLLELSEHFIGL